MDYEISKGDQYLIKLITEIALNEKSNFKIFK